MAGPWRASPLLKMAFGLALGASLLAGAWTIWAAVGTAPSRPDITDFHAVYLAGRMAATGRLDDAYRITAMLREEAALGGHASFMPWSYPPAYGLLAGPLYGLGLVPGFLVFAVASLWLYLAAMRRLSIVAWCASPGRDDTDGSGGEACWPVLLASFVPIMLNLRCGQNGLLTSGLAALAAGFVLRARPVSAGLALALLSIKPHLVITLPLWLMLRRRWLTLVIAAAGAAALTLASLVVFGPQVFTAFFASLPDVGRMMASGVYPLHRMTSIYASALSFGLPSSMALLLHGGVAAGVLVAVGRMVMRNRDLCLQLGLTILAGLFVSPYVYDYDQTLFGVGLLLVAPALTRRLSQPRYLLLLGGCGLAQSLGLLVNTLAGGAPEGAVSLMGPVLLAMLLTIMHCLRQPVLADPRRHAEVLPA